MSSLKEFPGYPILQYGLCNWRAMEKGGGNRFIELFDNNIKEKNVDILEYDITAAAIIRLWKNQRIENKVG